jgi:hypothetical protein
LTHHDIGGGGGRDGACQNGLPGKFHHSMLFSKFLAKLAKVKKSLWITNTIVSYCLDIKKLLSISKATFFQWPQDKGTRQATKIYNMCVQNLLYMTM